MPAALLLICPWVDPSARGGSLVANSDADRARPGYLVDRARDYLAGQPETHPLVARTFADLARFPPLLVQVGTVEMLLDQVRAFVAKAQAAGVEAGAFVRARTP